MHMNTTNQQLDYMAPEVMHSRAGYDARGADVWSCGVCLFAMLTGRFPFLAPQAAGGGGGGGGGGDGQGMVQVRVAALCACRGGGRLKRRGGEGATRCAARLLRLPNQINASHTHNPNTGPDRTTTGLRRASSRCSRR